MSAKLNRLIGDESVLAKLSQAVFIPSYDLHVLYCKKRRAHEASSHNIAATIMEQLVSRIVIAISGLIALQIASFVFLDVTSFQFLFHTHDRVGEEVHDIDTIISSSSSSNGNGGGGVHYDADDMITPAKNANGDNHDSTFVLGDKKASSRRRVNDDVGSTSSYIQCMLNLEKNELSVERIAHLEESNLTIPFAVKIENHRRFWVLAILNPENWFLRNKNKYYCNGIQAQVAKAFVKGFNMLVVACPESIDARNSSLHTFSGRPRSKRSQEEGEGYEFSFDMKAFEDCERKDIKAFDHLSGNAKTGIVAVFTGNRKEAFEWAVYHHTIGFDHVFLYVNEDWDHGKDLVHRDYITWIPYNFRLQQQGSISWEYFREAGMTDMVWRARRLKMKWLANVDVDEYVWLNGTLYSDDKPLERFLNTNPLPEGYGALELNSIPFGGQGTNSTLSTSPIVVDNKNHLNTTAVVEKEPATIATSSSKQDDHPDRKQQGLVIEYVYRQDKDVRSFKRSRYKIIVDTTKIVTAISCHYIGGGVTKNTYPLEANVIRVNHYKQPEKGVFNTYYNHLPPSAVIRDSDLMDRFFDVVSKEIASS